MALGLVHLFNVEHGIDAPASPAPADTRSYLESLDHGALVDLVLEAADTDPVLHRRLEMRATAATADGGDSSAQRVFVDRALRIDGFVEYHEAREYAGRVQEVADELGRLLDEGLSAEAERLCRYAIERLDEYLPLTDDSAGHVGEAAAQVVITHVEACELAGTDPDNLAGWLLKRQMDGSGIPELLLEDYADALGEEGLAHYGDRLVEARDARPSDDRNPRFLMTEFARVSGDVDLLVRMYAEGGSRAHHAGIVEALTEAGRHREALEWAEKGLAEPVDGRLVEYAARAYREAGRIEDLGALRWRAFENAPCTDTYRALRESAPETEWSAVRDQALALLTRSARRRSSRHFPCTLVEVLLWEDEADQAWEAAVEHGADDGQWLRLAALREADRPEDAIGVYAPRVRAKVALTDTALYPEAAALVRRVIRLYARVGRPEEGEAFLADLRQEHRRKRRFMAELDRLGL